MSTATKPKVAKPKKKVHTYKGFKIQHIETSCTADGIIVPEQFNVYTADEWAYGEGLRHVEWFAGTMQEARDFIDSY